MPARLMNRIVEVLLQNDADRREVEARCTARLDAIVPAEQAPAPRRRWLRAIGWMLLIAAIAYGIYLGVRPAPVVHLPPAISAPAPTPAPAPAVPEAFTNCVKGCTAAAALSLFKEVRDNAAGVCATDCAKFK